MNVFWNTRDWARAIAALPAEGPLPARTVLVPRERVAHALRRELIRIDQAEVLSGTRFVPLFVAAAEVLHAAGVFFTGREERLRPLRLRVLFEDPPALRYFHPQRLRETPGWDEAFARAIDDLEDSTLRPEQIAGRGDERLEDVAALWRMLDTWAAQSWTSGRVFSEAARALGQRSSLWPFEGSVLAAASADLSAAQARFLIAIPQIRLGVLPGRPLRSHYVQRLRRLFGSEAADAVATPRPRGGEDSERAILSSFLFEPPDVLADPSRPRSNGPDGSVDLEEHAGLEDEVEAAADWVARQVLESRTPLEDIALLTPQLDPLASLLVERLRRLPWPDGQLPVFVAGGLPLIGSAAGARMLAVLRALRAGLSAEWMANVLPCLRSADADRHLSHGAAKDLAFSLGTAGGSVTDPSGALDWSAGAARRERDIAQWLERARAASGEEEQAGAARSATDLERLLADLRAIRPAIDALVGVARLTLQGAALARLWEELRSFLDAWMLAPGAVPPPWALLDETLAAVCADERFARLSGSSALAVVEQSLRALRAPVGRFGEPSVYVGTIRDAVGIPFSAVRMLHLAEGTVPPTVAENPVLAEPLRSEVGAGLLVSAADRALAELQALDRVVRDVQGSLVFSAPRFGVERTDREPSSIFVEVAAALGRPNRTTRERDRLIPNATALQRDSFVPSREGSQRFRGATPISAAAWLDWAAEQRNEVPASWQGRPALDLRRIATLLSSPQAGSLDGYISSSGPTWQPVGLTADRPISASALRDLLDCPHRFLFERVFSWRRPADSPPRRTIDSMSYGGLLHRIVEAFFREHGVAFGERTRSASEWQTVAAEIANRHFDLFCREYPLVGETVREQQRHRVLRDFGLFLDYDWSRGRTRRFVAVERSFGAEHALEFSTGVVPLYLRGFIDRIDVEDGRTVVRDLKTGRAKPRVGREAALTPHVDLQLAVYGIAAGLLAAAWGVPAEVAAAYMYADARGEPERSFREDFATLREAAVAWLDLAARLLDERLFPRTPVDDDCEYCPFLPVCGPEARARSTALLAEASGTLALFRGLKSGVVEDEEP